MMSIFVTQDGFFCTTNSQCMHRNLLNVFHIIFCACDSSKLYSKPRIIFIIIIVN